MMQIHQGVDIVDVARFKEVAGRNRNFLSDIFTSGEMEYCLSMKDPHPHFAGRFAAKEACLKALGIGMSPTGTGHSLREIEISRHPSGRPQLSLKGWAATISKRKRIRQHTVSISHTSGTAVATVMLVAEQDYTKIVLRTGRESQR
jgi:holo-[acyl-carrier protein] synthase